MFLETTASSSGFIKKNIAGASFWVYQPLWDQGILHGFGGVSQSDHRELVSEFNLTRLVSVDQVHGATVVDLRFSGITAGCKLEADAIIGIKNRNLGDRDSQKRNQGIFIQSADCAPIIIVGKSDLALIHAGWRGLAGAVIANTLRLMDAPEIALIGPCAGDCCYEVGAEVLADLADMAVTRMSRGGSYLSIGRSAAKILKHTCPNLTIFDIDLCTVCNQAFNSYRRNKTTQRNLTFSVVAEPGLSIS